MSPSCPTPFACSREQEQERQSEADWDEETSEDDKDPLAPTVELEGHRDVVDETHEYENAEEECHFFFLPVFEGFVLDKVDEDPGDATVFVQDSVYVVTTVPKTCRSSHRKVCYLPRHLSTEVLRKRGVRDRVVA